MPVWMNAHTSVHLDTKGAHDMTTGIDAPGSALHRAWRLPGQGPAATLGTRRASPAPDRFTNALRALSTTSAPSAVTQDSAVTLSHAASARRQT